MDKKYFPRKFRVYLPLILLFGLLTFLMPRASKFKYDYRKGEPWMYETLVSQFDFPILKTDRQLADDMKKVSSQVLPCYRHNASVSRRAMETLADVDFGSMPDIRANLVAALEEIYSKGVISSSGVQKDTSLSRLIYIQRIGRLSSIRC